MIIGKGFISRSIKNIDNVNLFLSGTSDSSCKNKIIFKKEQEKILPYLSDTIVYLSSITVLQNVKTPYIFHKITMENIIKTKQEKHLILRLPNVLGKESPPHQLVSNLVSQIKKGSVKIQDKALRYILDVDVLNDIIIKFLNEKKYGIYEVIPSKPIIVNDLIEIISNILNLNPQKIYVKSKDYPNFEKFKNAIIIDTNYINLIKKYINKH